MNTIYFIKVSQSYPKVKLAYQGNINYSNRSMTKPTDDDLNQSIEEISAYRDRLKQALIENARKLQIPTHKINSSLEGNLELNHLKTIIEHLKSGHENN